MALISTKNLVAPLTNKVHLTSLVLIAVAFAAVRFAGGAVTIERAGMRGRAAASEEARKPVPAPSLDEDTRRGVGRLRNAIGGLGNPPPESEPAKKEPTPPAQRKNGLAEIEKTLGL